ncbi:MAG: hypothetical protein OXG64_06445 [Chloroflexi bacterium]|nr:hypothetical protein [Chloroflexota bacterium]
MTADDQALSIARMVQERNALRQEVATLDRQLDQVSTDLNAARTMIDRTRRGHLILPTDGAYLRYSAVDDLAANLQRLREANARIVELDDLLDAC